MRSWPPPRSSTSTALLGPIAEDRPSGRSLVYEPEYDALRDARRSDDDTPQGDWLRRTKSAQWDRVVALGTSLLKEETKDLQVAAWIVEALARLHGFAGLRDGLALVRAIQERFWDSYFPEIEDGDVESRLRAVPLPGGDPADRDPEHPADGRVRRAGILVSPLGGVAGDRQPRPQGPGPHGGPDRRGEAHHQAVRRPGRPDPPPIL